MKRITQFVALILALSVVLAVPASAAELEPRGSSYFITTSCYLVEKSSTQFQVWYDVSTFGTMEEVGVTKIIIQRSKDASNWEGVYTFTKENYPSLVASNTGTHCGYVTYSNRASGYYYRAYVKFYAKNGNGDATYGFYTSHI